LSNHFSAKKALVVSDVSENPKSRNRKEEIDKAKIIDQMGF